MSKVVLYMAISADGFIAGPNDETPWSDEEWKSFQAFVRSCDACLVGRETYRIMKAENAFIEGTTYIVVTNDPSVDTGSYEKRAIVSAADMPDFNMIGVIGGGELNGSLAVLGLIDELILDVEPIILGQGKRLFGSHEVNLNLELLSSKQIGSGTIQNKYQVLQ